MLALILSSSLNRLEQLQEQALEAGARVNCLADLDAARAILRRYPDQIDLLVIDVDYLPLRELVGLQGNRSHASVMFVSDRKSSRRRSQFDVCALSKLKHAVVSKLRPQEEDEPSTLRLA